MTPTTKKATVPQFGLVCITHSDEVRYKTVTRKRLLQFPADEQKRLLRGLARRLPGRALGRGRGQAQGACRRATLREDKE